MEVTCVNIKEKFNEIENIAKNASFAGGFFYIVAYAYILQDKPTYPLLFTLRSTVINFSD